MMPGTNNPCAIITSEISGIPVAKPPIAPKANIRMFPTKKAATVEITAILGLLENRVKSGVKVPPEINEPITKPNEAVIPSVLTSVIFARPANPPTPDKEIPVE